MDPELFLEGFIRAGDEPLFNTHYKGVIKAGILLLDSLVPSFNSLKIILSL